MIDSIRTRLSGELHAGPDTFLTWREISRELRQGLEGDRAFFDIAIAIILFVVLLGVASAQLTAVLERRKEFAVLAAVGMRGHALVRVVLVEGLALGLGASLLALGWAGPILYSWSRGGVDLSSMLEGEEGWAFGGVLIEPVFYPEFGSWVAPTALALSLVATITASLYPAWFASRTDPATALRLDR